VPPSAGCETQRGGLQSPAGLFPGPPQGADRGIGDGRPRHGGEGAGAHEPGPVPGVTPVGCAPVTRLCGQAGGRDHPADSVFFGQSTREPSPTRAGCSDKDPGVGLRWPLPHQGGAVLVPGAKGPQGADLGVMLFGDGGHSDRRFGHSHADVTRARLVPGCPPRLWHACWRQDAMLVPGSDPAMLSGAAYPSEVIMSRRLN
jgi:hypothetical protein